jgi:hypothetical protein
MNDLIYPMLYMKMDVYRQVDSQDASTGAIKKEWNFYETIPCSAKGSITNSSTSRGGDKEVYSTKYAYNQFIDVRTLRKLNSREKVTNISNQSGEVIWEELNYPTSTPTVFEVTGTTPITDPFGSVLGYNSTLKRSENQQIGI